LNFTITKGNTIMPTLRLQNVSDDLLDRIKARAHREAPRGMYDLAAIGRHLFTLYADHGMAALEAAGSGFVPEKADDYGAVPPNDHWGNR
jgi:hypothetical protein